MIKVKEEAETQEEEIKKLKFITRKAAANTKKPKDHTTVIMQIPLSLLEEVDKDVIYDVEGTRSSWMRDAFREKLNRSKRKSER